MARWLAAASLLGFVGLASATASLSQLAPNPTTYVEGVDFSAFTPPPVGATEPFAGTAVGWLQEVPVDADTGCQAADFAGFIAGNIALIQRGVCFFSDKINNAMLAGAIGVLIFDNIDEPVTTTGYQLATPTFLPALVISHTLGLALEAQLASQGRVQIAMATPEPGSIALVGLAGAALLLARRRRPQ